MTMKMFIVFPICALMISRLPHRCDGCLDMLMKPFLQVFNPNVEIQPDRLINRHRYADGFMPDYRPRKEPAATKPTRTKLVANDDDGVPTADYVDYGVAGADGRRVGNQLPTRPGIPEDSTGDPVAMDAATGRAIPPADQPLSDFIVSLLQTVQLTSRAALKKSKNKGTTNAAVVSAPPPPLRFDRFGRPVGRDYTTYGAYQRGVEADYGPSTTTKNPSIFRPFEHSDY